MINLPNLFLLFGVGWGVQVEVNIEFVQKKRDDVAFSPKDQQSVELFIQVSLSLSCFSFLSKSMF